MTLRVRRARVSASGGKSHSWVTATTESPAPSAKSISVADGTRLAIRMGTNSMLPAVDRLDDDQISARLDELEGWEREGDAIVKTFKRDDFVGSVKFVDALVEPAEDMGHHPDVSISWNEVRVSVTTHSEGGLTANDFELASRIDSLA